MKVKNDQQRETQRPDLPEVPEDTVKNPTEDLETQADLSTESSPSTPSTEAPPDWQDRHLRLAAEFDNFRKRTAREYIDLVRNAERDLIGELTEVLDNLGRAVDADHKGEPVAEFAKGVALIRDQLSKALASRGLEKMESVGQQFDPSAHDALLRMPSGEHPEGTVIQEVAPGYRLGDKVLRHAKVIVSQGKPQDEPADNGQDKE